MTVTFPNTAVLYLRSHDKTPDKMKYVIVTPGGTVRYDVPIMKTQAYTLDEIFEKHLLFLIPFHIFSHEKNLSVYNSDKEKLEKLKAEYRIILDRLDKLERQGALGAFDKRTIIELSGDVIKEIARKYENVQKGVGDMMVGPLIDTTSRKIRNEARNETQREAAIRMLEKGKLTIKEIAEYAGLTVAEVEQLAASQPV